jgi:uncharacterized repeat protein (TIGR01451 family)
LNTTIVATGGTPHIVFTKTGSVANAKSGDTVTFTINYQNTGPGDAAVLTITDTIPAGTTLVWGSISSPGSLTGNILTWPLRTVTAGSSGSVSFQVTVN